MEIARYPVGLGVGSLLGSLVGETLGLFGLLEFGYRTVSRNISEWYIDICGWNMSDLDVSCLSLDCELTTSLAGDDIACRLSFQRCITNDNTSEYRWLKSGFSTR